MCERLTDEQLREFAEYGSALTFQWKGVATELLALRAAWRIAEPHLPPEVYRRALAALKSNT